MVNETKKTNYSRVIDSQLNTASEARWQIHHKYESLQEQMFTVLLHLFNYKNGKFKHRHSTITQKQDTSTFRMPLQRTGRQIASKTLDISMVHPTEKFS